MDHTTHLPLSGPHSGTRVPAAVPGAMTWLGAVLRTLRERRQLAMLDEHALKDIGISRADAYREWSRPFWDLPGQR